MLRSPNFKDAAGENTRNTPSHYSSHCPLWNCSLSFHFAHMAQIKSRHPAYKEAVALPVPALHAPTCQDVQTAQRSIGDQGCCIREGDVAQAGPGPGPHAPCTRLLLVTFDQRPKIDDGMRDGRNANTFSTAHNRYTMRCAGHATRRTVQQHRSGDRQGLEAAREGKVTWHHDIRPA